MDGSPRKPALVQDTEYMSQKTYHIAPYFSAFGAYLLPQWPIYGSKGVSIYQNNRWSVTFNVLFHLAKKPLVLVKTKDYMVGKT